MASEHVRVVVIVFGVHEFQVFFGRITLGIEGFEAVLAGAVAGIALLVIEDPLVDGLDIGFKDSDGIHGVQP